MTTIDVEIWWAAVESTRLPLDVLDDVERERLSRFRDPAAGNCFTAGATLVRMVGSCITGVHPRRVTVDRRCRRCGGPHGRPVLVGADVELSLTHARNLVGLAVSRTVPIGLDVESVSRLPAGRSTTRWSAMLGKGDRGWSGELLLRHWVRVESLVKATGDGFTVRPDQVLVSDPDDEPTLFDYPGRPGLAVSMRDLRPARGFVGCLSALTGVGVSATERRTTLRTSGEDERHHVEYRTRGPRQSARPSHEGLDA